MVLKRAVLLLLLIGCKQSLFDANGGDGDNVDSGVTGDGMVQTTCGAMCLGDAGGEVGDPKWQYLEDNRNRTWTAMTGTGPFTGADPANKISSCAQGSAPACAALPGALLMSSAGSTGTADAAIAFKSDTKQVIKLSLRVRVEGNNAAQIRLYRNSREDALYTAIAQPGVTAEFAIQVDALANDRFVFALTPATTSVEDVAVELFINGTGMAFPQQCMMAVQWNTPQQSGLTLNDCGMPLTYYDDSGTTTMQTAAIIGEAPFAELDKGGTILPDHYFESGDLMDRSGPNTTQFWIKQTVVGFTNAATVSDADLNKPGGLGIYLDTINTITAETCNDATNVTFVQATGAYPQDMKWHFVRVTQTSDTVALCLDGKRLASYAIPATGMQSNNHPFIGRSPTNATEVLEGGIDDLRIYKGALPCE